ncbi:MAG: hypothetical protein F6K40_03085 [Okeania sp. SIO3I5]|uniref:AAA-like domain-containing protein n=1 Tax=Okeania sp. SIO3I5 TaxID=2607805 RepID=UPI0013B6F373|nr:AAA-like domain-containing protein [Okeania sp. SIO3I5]NEQ35346.1 hypothetical protein [Okeania sp. SIO3I5]
MTKLLENPENQKNYDDLIVSIEASFNSLNILVAVCDDSEYREEIIQMYEQELSPYIPCYRVQIPKGEPSLRAAIASVVETDEYLQAGKQAVITVTGVDGLRFLSFDGERTEQDKFLGYLQWTREALRHFPFSIVLWMTFQMQRSVGKKAPDFWAWCKGVFRFVSFQKMALPKQDVDFLNHVDFLNPTLGEKWNEVDDDDPHFLPVADLQELIADIEREKQVKNASLVTLYRSLGNIFDRRVERGECENYQQETELAIKYFQKAIALQQELGSKGGYILTKAGREKVQKIYLVEQSLNKISKKADLHRTTVGKIFLGNGGVSSKSIKIFSDYVTTNYPFSFEEYFDYEKCENQSRKIKKSNPAQDTKSPNYIQRLLIEQKIYKSLLSTNYIIRIKAPKKMGKTILINRALEQFKAKENSQIVSISFQEADNSDLSQLNKLLRWLCANVSSQLELPVKLDDWDNVTKEFGSKVTCNNYFEKYLLPELKCPMVLFLDNLELLRINEIDQDFLGMLRSWSDKASRNHLWQRLRLVISYTPNIEMKINPNQSPFNIGTTIEVPEFTSKQVQQLAENYQLNLDNYQVEELMKMVAGHPYLVDLTFHSLKTCNAMTLEKILETAPTKDGIYHSPYLQEYLATLKQHSDIAQYFLKIINAEDIRNIETNAIKTLMNLGLIKDIDGKILVSCKLYRLYFENYLRDVK